MDDDFGILQQVSQGDAMSNTQDRTDSSLLWDCFTNWSLTLEKIKKQKTSAQEVRKQE
jgi:hypothetical protein